MNYVYILRCADDTLYCGWTTDIEKRLAAHNSGNGAKYTRSRGPVALAYLEEHEDRHEALSREWHIKRMSRKEKMRLVKVYEEADVHSGSPMCSPSPCIPENPKAPGEGRFGGI